MKRCEQLNKEMRAQSYGSTVVRSEQQLRAVLSIASPELKQQQTKVMERQNVTPPNPAAAGGGVRCSA